MPQCTTAGDYQFEVSLCGDGIGYTTQQVNVTVVPVSVSLDVHPTGCPNPLNTKSNGLMPAAILGTASFDVSEIDVSSIRINGAAPIRDAIEDVATPYDPVPDKALDARSCNTQGADGYDDLTLKFKIQDILAILGAPVKGDLFKLELTANLLDGNCVIGEDIVIIAK